MKKILLIHTGGTFGMVPAKPGRVLAPGNLQDRIIQHVPEISQICEIDVEIPFNLDSSNIGISEWDALADLIFRRMDNYDGFVIIHGTDTMVYTASALSFSLLNLRKPVILTGAQRPLAKLRTDARSNLIDAVELATMDLPEVIIAFGQNILRGNRCKKISITSYDAFASPNYPLLGEIGLNIRLNRELLLKPHGKLRLLSGFKPAVAVLHVQPSLSPDNMRSLLNSNLQVFVLVGFGAGNLPNRESDWITFVREMVSMGKVIFIASQSSHGNVDLELYEAGQQALEAGAHALHDMTIEASYIKLMKILYMTNDPAEIAGKCLQNWAGEIQ